MVSALAAFLLARYDEDETTARQAQDDLVRAGGMSLRASSPDEIAAFKSMSDLAWRYSPERVLADCAAKRDMVERLAWVLDYPGQHVSWVEFATTQLRLLALPYADHPDYRQEWKP